LKICWIGAVHAACISISSQALSAGTTGSSQPRRMTMDEAVDGLAQPRLALTSTFFT
jgi:hypothetical protein